MRTVWSVKVRSGDATLLHEARDSVAMEHCSTLLQVFPTMSDCESWERTTSCSQDVVEGGLGSDAPRNKVASYGLTFRLTAMPMLLQHD